MKISDFYKNEFVSYSSYDNLRKIASLVDGQKNASRKVLYTVLEKNINKEIKLSQLGSKVSEFSEYLHGNLDGVIVTLAQNFAGTNNIPLMTREGNFGTRFSPEASASRYIFTFGAKEFFELFKKEDVPVLKHQTFEGDEIEPMFYVPNLPLLVINGADGLSSGFRQVILPRNPDEVKKYVIAKMSGKNSNVELKPFYNGFTGTVEQGETSRQWLIKGVVKRKSANRVEISEVPVGYDLKSYLKVLDALEDKKIIQSYKDKSENDKFLFDVHIQSKVLKLWSDDELLSQLKLIKKVSEIYTAMDENNKIDDTKESVKEIIDHYTKVKLEYLQYRKDYQLKKLLTDISFDESKLAFINAVVTNKLKINKRKKSDIIIDLEKMKTIIQKDNSYDYLLRMSMLTLTIEEMDRLKCKIQSLKNTINDLKNKTVQEIWKSEI